MNAPVGELAAAMQELTGVENPNSVQQMKQWLAEHGLETDTLGKKAVAEFLKTAPEPLRTVLSLRQQLAKSSVKKYTAMENAVCKDGRAHGMFQFYGANPDGAVFRAVDSASEPSPEPHGGFGTGAGIGSGWRLRSPISAL